MICPRARLRRSLLGHIDTHTRCYPCGFLHAQASRQIKPPERVLRVTGELSKPVCSRPVASYCRNLQPIFGIRFVAIPLKNFSGLKCSAGIPGIRSLKVWP